MKSICQKCRKNNNHNNKFCIYCGTKISLPKPKDDEYIKVFHSVEGISVALLAKVAKCDGNISVVEATYMGKIYDTFSRKSTNSQVVRDIFKQILAKEKGNLQNVSELCQILMGLNISITKKLELIKMLVGLAYVDNNYTKEEENLIVKIVNHLDVPYSEYKKIVDAFVPKQEERKEEKNTFNNTSFSNLTLNDCYAILETNSSTTQAQLKIKYRELVKNYHTDILKSKNLPKDMIDFAEEKLKSINFAYEKIKKHKGF